MKPTTFAECMDVFDWFDVLNYDYLTHIMLAKLDAEAPHRRALPAIIKDAANLIAIHAGTEEAYPIDYLTQPA